MLFPLREHLLKPACKPFYYAFMYNKATLTYSVLIMKRTLFTLFLATISGYSLAADQQQITVSLTSASTMTQGMAMVLANQMQEQGAQVHILLCDQAGDIALKGAAGEPLKPNNVTPAQLLNSALKKGATASVCALYLPNSNQTADDLREDIKPASPVEMGTSLLEKNRKIIGF